jgi:hypothetical protein
MVRVVTPFSRAACEIVAPCRISFRAWRERSRAEELRPASFGAWTRRALLDLECGLRAGADGCFLEACARERLREIAFRWRLRHLGLFFISLPTSLTLLLFIGAANSGELDLRGQPASSWVIAA